jgi:sugar-specific transcriptional regulator TrmB
MKTQEIKNFLKKLGLSSKEIRIYLYCLQKGPQLMTNIAKATDTTRTNLYDIAKKLESKGVCFATGGAYGKRLEAVSPKDLISLLEHKESEIYDLKEELQILLPFFKEVQEDNLSSTTKVSYYEGKDNLQKLLWKSLDSESKIIRIAGSELDIATALGKDFISKYHQKRLRDEVELKGIRPDSKRLTGDIFQDDKKYLRDIRKRPKGKIKMKSNILIWDNKIALYSLKDNLFGNLIENESMAVMLSTWFDFIWDHSEKM